MARAGSQTLASRLQHPGLLVALTAGVSAHPELVEERAPPGVVLVVDDAFGDELDGLVVVEGHPPCLVHDVAVDLTPEVGCPLGIVDLSGRSPHDLAIDRGVAEAGGVAVLGRVRAEAGANELVLEDVESRWVVVAPAVARDLEPLALR